MPDISMCDGGACPKKAECYRFRAIPNPYRQLYFTIVPYDTWDKTCKYFYQIKEGDDVRESEAST